MKIMKTLMSYKEALEKDGYNVLYIGLYGSQNYNVDDDKSDIDAKVIILPTIDDIVFRKTTSFVKEFDTGACDVKDLITYYNVVKKGNFSFTEPFHTPYFLGSVYLKCIFGQIPVNKMSILGGMYEKQKALTHKYPSKEKEFEMFGCDPKQYHHIVRLYDLAMSKQLEKSPNTPFLRYFDEDADYMRKIKRGMEGKTIEELLDDTSARIEKVKEWAEKFDKYEEADLEFEVGNFLKQRLREELLYEKR